MAPSFDDDERIALLRRHVAFMEGQCAELERAWERVPRLAVVVLFAIPAWIVWGLGAAVIVVALTGALIVTGAYLTGVRRGWAKSELANTRRDLARLEGPRREMAGLVEWEIHDHRDAGDKGR